MVIIKHWGRKSDIDIWNVIRVSGLREAVVILVCCDHLFQILCEAEKDGRDQPRSSPKGGTMESAHSIATAQGYYPSAAHQGMYTQRDYSQGQYHSYSQASCAYSGKPTSPMGYNTGQTMTVVDQYGLPPHADAPGSAAGLSAHSFTLAAAAALQGHQAPHPPHHHHHNHLQPHHLNGSTLTQPFTHQHLRNHHLADRHPPPAHNQNQLLHHTRRPDGKVPGSEGRGTVNQKNLHFPWMKTTKSHAHQWKAGWSGRSRRAAFSRFCPSLSAEAQHIQTLEQNHERCTQWCTRIGWSAGLLAKVKILLEK